MFSRFFIYRPVFALVISIVILLLGAITIPILPIENTPDITPPTVTVSASCPGASAPVIAETVAAPLEQEINGVDNMIYMESKSSDDGSMNLTVTFEIGVDVDMSTVLVQNRVAIADPKLPEDVKRQGITTKKKSSNIESSFLVGYLGSRISPGGLEHVDLLMRHLESFPSSLMWFALFAGLHPKRRLHAFSGGVGRFVVHLFIRKANGQAGERPLSRSSRVQSTQARRLEGALAAR